MLSPPRTHPPTQGGDNITSSWPAKKFFAGMGPICFGFVRKTHIPSKKRKINQIGNEKSFSNGAPALCYPPSNPPTHPPP